MLGNEIKKGATIVYRGMQAMVLDNKKSLSRKISFAGPMGPAKGDSYVFDWEKVLINGTWEQIELEPKQIEQANSIKKMMGRT